MGALPAPGRAEPDTGSNPAMSIRITIARKSRIVAGSRFGWAGRPPRRGSNAHLTPITRCNACEAQ